MKKTAIAVGLILGFTGLVYGASIMSGDFGVGIATPGAKLDVQGNGASSATTSFRVRNSTLADILAVRDDRRVGINTAAPDYTLDVNGDAGFNEYLYHNADADTFLRFDADDSIQINAGGALMMSFRELAADSLVINDNGLDIDFRVEGSGVPNAFFVNGLNGRVGINNANPNYNLDVVGTVGFDQFIYHNGDTDTYVEYGTDNVNLYAGGLQMLTLSESTADAVILNEAGADIDFRVEGTGAVNAIFVNGANA